MLTYCGGRGPIYSSPAPIINILTLGIVTALKKATLQSHGHSERQKLACEYCPVKIEIIGCCSDACVVLLVDREC